MNNERLKSCRDIIIELAYYSNRGHGYIPKNFSSFSETLAELKKLKHSLWSCLGIEEKDVKFYTLIKKGFNRSFAQDLIQIKKLWET